MLAFLQLAFSKHGPDLSTILTSGWAVIVVGGLLSFKVDSGAIVVLVVLVIGIGAIYAGQICLKLVLIP